jgi:hypothetical protein
MREVFGEQSQKIEKELMAVSTLGAFTGELGHYLPEM